MAGAQVDIEELEPVVEHFLSEANSDAEISMPEGYVFEVELRKDVFNKLLCDGRHSTWIHDLVMDAKSNQLAGFVAGGSNFWYGDHLNERVFVPYTALENRFGVVSSLDDFFPLANLPERYVPLYETRIKVNEQLIPPKFGDSHYGSCLSSEEREERGPHSGVKERTVRPFRVRIRDNGDVTLVFMETISLLKARHIHYASRPSAINWADGVLTGTIRSKLYEFHEQSLEDYRVDESTAIDRWMGDSSSFPVRFSDLVNMDDKKPFLWYIDDQAISGPRGQEGQDSVEPAQQMQYMIHYLTAPKQILPLNLFPKSNE